MRMKKRFRSFRKHEQISVRKAVASLADHSPSNTAEKLQFEWVPGMMVLQQR